MADILIRDIPLPVKQWLDEQRYQRRQSQREFLLEIIMSHLKASSGQTLPLFPPVEGPTDEHGPVPFRFIDLFAGIGGMRIGLEANGGECVFSSEWDKHAQKTYHAWFGETPTGDIREVDPSSIPDHDVLTAGFPCQPFSIAGVSKKKSLGRSHGFDDPTQGTLFFNVKEIIAAKRPPAILLENVKNLKSHDRGRTWQVIKGTIEDQLNYWLFPAIIDAAGWVPQHRERVFMVGFDRELFPARPDFRFPKTPSGPPPIIRDILEPNVEPRFTLTSRLWEYLQGYAAKHRALGNGFGFGLTPLDGVARTLSARYYKDGSEILIPQGPNSRPRRLTPREAARLMGFPESKDIVVSDTQAYKQFGNAVVPPVVAAIGQAILRVFATKLVNGENGCLLKRPPMQHRAA